jgi:hypothetical protein
MTSEEFRQSLDHDAPPANLSIALAALWWDGKGDWKQAHDLLQQDEGPQGSWVHAYLHRKEGDASNAAYWYRRVDKPPSQSSLEQEWLEIAASLLSEAKADS